LPQRFQPPADQGDPRATRVSLAGDFGSDASGRAGDEHGKTGQFQPLWAPEQASGDGQCSCCTDSRGTEHAGGVLDHDHSPISFAMIIFITSLVPP
jgi:hypothetical protein